MRIYTKQGDDGTTGLIGGRRVDKSSIRIEVCGQIDELNASIGLAVSLMAGDGGLEELRKPLEDIQHQLFVLGAETANPDIEERQPAGSVTGDKVRQLEKLIDHQDSKLSPLKRFILPGGSRIASQLHVARTICRRTERGMVSLSRQENMNEHMLIYLNRLSDLLFVFARAANHCHGEEDVFWQQDPGSSS